MPHSSPLRNVISVFSFCSVISPCPSSSPGNSFIVGSSSVPSSLISLSPSPSLCPSLCLCLWHSPVPFLSFSLFFFSPLPNTQLIQCKSEILFWHEYQVTYFLPYCGISSDTRGDVSIEYRRKCLAKYVRTLIMCAHALLFVYVCLCVSFIGILSGCFSTNVFAVRSRLTFPWMDLCCWKHCRGKKWMISLFRHDALFDWKQERSSRSHIQVIESCSSVCHADAGGTLWCVAMCHTQDLHPGEQGSLPVWNKLSAIFFLKNEPWDGIVDCWVSFPGHQILTLFVASSQCVSTLS